MAWEERGEVVWEGEWPERVEELGGSGLGDVSGEGGGVIWGRVE